LGIDLKRRYPLRPTRVFAVPIPLGILGDRIILKGRTYVAKEWSEVERLSLDGMDEVQARNYYRVELEQGTSIWIFSDPSHHFFIHGYYE
jgi:hypothetical protein